MFSTAAKKLLVLFTLLIAMGNQASASPEIARMVATPVSAFDLFLFRIYESAKCNNVLKNNNADEADLCMSSLNYDADNNILSAFFRVLPGAESMDEFIEEDAARRKAILLALLNNTARRVGALDQWGLIHNLPIGYNPSFSQSTEKAFRAELANRTSTILSTSYDGVVYTATRHFDGKIEYISNP